MADTVLNANSQLIAHETGAIHSTSGVFHPKQDSYKLNHKAKSAKKSSWYFPSLNFLSLE
jgi:hypothetical protein